MREIYFEEGDVLSLGDVIYEDLEVSKKIEIYGNDFYVIHNAEGLVGILAEDSKTKDIISITALGIAGFPHELNVGTFNRVPVYDNDYGKFFKILEEVRSRN